MQKRYEALELRAALSRRIDFEQACNELTAILQRGYGHAPKKLQILIFEDVLFAVHQLSELETSLHLLAVTKLVQAAENVLPRQKKTQVVGKFKHAAVAHRRHKKSLQSESKQGEGGSDIGTDILVVIFGHLDARSLARAAVVCRSWNTAASDELLWKNLFDVSFTNVYCKKPAYNVQGLQACSKEPINWRLCFKDTVKRYPLWFYASSRALCLVCDGPIWFEGKRKGLPVCPICGAGPCKLKPLVPIQVSQFLLEESTYGISSSSSDSDSEDSTTKYSNLWTIPKYSKLWTISKLDVERM